MITKEEAHAVAAREVARSFQVGPAAFADWAGGTVGEPVLVHDVFGRPSYWLLPYVAAGRTVGFVRLWGTGRVFAMGTWCAGPGQIERCPAVVTGITADEARRRFQAAVALRPGETVEEPIFVHDGPPGREAWLVETRSHGRPARWVFLTPGGAYERRAGETLDEALEA
jgi:hypothetical protein